MSFPQDALAPKSELPLGTLVQLMSYPAKDPLCNLVECALPREYLAHIGIDKPKTFDRLDNTRTLTLNELIKEALPWITMINEIEESRSAAVREKAAMEKQRDKTNERIKELESFIRIHVPQVDWEDDEYDYSTDSKPAP